jgi:hypothetical protein
MTLPPRAGLPSEAQSAAEQLLSTSAHSRCLEDPDEPLSFSDPAPAKLTVEQSSAVGAFRMAIVADLRSWPAAAQREAKGHLDDLTLFRFMEARPAGLSAALGMFRDAMAWRSTDNRCVNRAFTAHHPMAPDGLLVAAGRKHFYAGFVGFDRNSEPIFGERLGKVDLPGLAREGEPLQQLLMDAYIAYLETAFRMVRAASCATGTLVKSTFVVDATGFSLSMLRHVGLIKAFAAIGPPYYPEVTHSVIIVNAPRFASAAWAIIGPLMPKATREKVSVHSVSTSAAVLAQRFDLTELPGYLGGTKSDSECFVAQALKIPRGLSDELRTAYPALHKPST